jgi:secondary thiamine-phosphate synthase enzyme
MLLSVQTRAKTEFIDITSQIQGKVKETGIEDGCCLIYVPHTTAAVTINESADPSVANDILNTLNRIVPWEAAYTHLEGNSAAHVKSTLVGISEMVAIENSRLVLGTWQGIFFCEFDGPRTRTVKIKIF